MRIIDQALTKQELIDSSSNFIDEDAIKCVVDVKRGIMAVDAPMHYELEQLLLENGSEQANLWGLNLYLDSDDIDDLIEFDSMINIRPSQNNRTRSVENPKIRKQIQSVITKWLK